MGFMTKRYVSVLVLFDEVGNKTPKQIFLEDVCYEINKVLEIKNAASLKVGGIGERFKVRINKTETFLFYEKEVEKWFVELK